MRKHKRRYIMLTQSFMQRIREACSYLSFKCSVRALWQAQAIQITMTFKNKELYQFWLIFELIRLRTLDNLISIRLTKMEQDMQDYLKLGLK
jgi:hypothetical protein